MESAELEHTVVSTISYARQVSGVRVITCPADYSIAGNDLAAIKTKTKELTEKRLDMTRPLDESKKRIMELFKRPLDALAEAERLLKAQMMSYSARIAEEERKARQEAEREAAKLAAEARAKEQAAREMAAQAKTLIEAKVAQVMLAEAKELAIEAATPELYVEVAPKAQGVSTRDVWKFEIVDESLIPRQWLTPDLKRIGEAARGGKDLISIPGVRIYAEKVMSAKSY